jgi:DNA-binding LacI/PurR family transcriptional regulator
MTVADDNMGMLARQKKSAREDRIAVNLRRRIVAGVLHPGMRLPTRVQLQKEFDSANETVQRAMSRLIDDGFLVPRGRLGTFVAEKPSHLHRYGVVFCGDPADPMMWETMKFQMFLYREVLEMQSSRKRDIVSYTKVDGHTDSGDYQRLVNDIQNERLAGVIFDVPTYLTKPPLSAVLDTPGMPFVTIMDGTSHPNLSAVSLNRYQVMEHALDYLHAHKRQRVALLAGSGSYDSQLVARFEREVARHGMTTRPYWMQSILPGAAKWARNCANLLMNAKEVPDALFIDDDNLVEYATAGLVDAGVRIPQDLEVVAHCNFPAITPSMVPAKRIGFDVRQVLNTCLDVIARRRRHENVSGVTEVNPLFDDEVELRATGGNDNDGGIPPVPISRNVQETEHQEDSHELVNVR